MKGNRTNHARVCNCQKFGCVTCMQRYLRQHYRKENKRGKRGQRWQAVGVDEFKSGKAIRVISNPKGTYRIYEQS